MEELQPWDLFKETFFIKENSLFETHVFYLKNILLYSLKEIKNVKHYEMRTWFLLF